MSLTNNVRYAVFGTSTILFSVIYHLLVYEYDYGAYFSIITGVVMGLVIILGAAFGVTVALVWKERDERHK